MDDNEVNIKLYHGTTGRCADAIYSIGFKCSTKNNEWLGKGVYFFCKRQDAKWWADLQIKIPENINEIPEIIEVNINCLESEIFDLDISQNMDILNDEISPVIKAFGNNGMGCPKFKNDAELRCFCCNLYKKKHSNVKVMAYSFPATNGQVAYNSLGFFASIIRKQYCVNNNEIITLNKREAVDYAI